MLQFTFFKHPQSTFMTHLTLNTQMYDTTDIATTSNNDPNKNQLSQKNVQLLIQKSQMRKRIHSAGDQILSTQQYCNIFETIESGSSHKRTYCYKMVTKQDEKYFVKIFEDSTTNPCEITQKLLKQENQTLKEKLSPYILIPAFQPQQEELNNHTYHLVIYPFINHCNLQQLTIKALKQKPLAHINPNYHLKHSRTSTPHSLGYLMRMLKIFKKVMIIVMKLKEHGLVDMDLR